MEGLLAAAECPLMARFKICMMGTAQAPILELDARDVAELHHSLGRARFVEGRMVEIDGGGADCVVLIPLNRIQMIFEMDE